MSDSDGVTGKLTAISADNPVVKSLINGRDEGQTPDGFNPNHATGDTGNAYEFSQCTCRTGRCPKRPSYGEVEEHAWSQSCS